MLADPSGQGVDILSAIDDREVFFRAVLAGRTDHLVEDRDYGITRQVEDFGRFAKVAGYSGQAPDWAERNIETELRKLIQQGFVLEAFLGARQGALDGLHSGMHISGQLWLEIGHLEDGLRWLEKAARDGYPSALASHGWGLLRFGQHERAAAFFDEVWPRCQAFGQSHDGMSATHSRSGACAVNWRFTLSSGVGAPAGIVVRGALALLTHRGAR